MTMKSVTTKSVTVCTREWYKRQWYGGRVAKERHGVSVCRESAEMHLQGTVCANVLFKRNA